MMLDLLRTVDQRIFERHLTFYERALAQALDGPWESLLDVGCGAQSALNAVSHHIPVSVGVDAHAASIEASRAAGHHSDYCQMDMLEIADRFGAASFDVVAALDVVEHLEKNDGFRLLDGLETVARHVVVVFTPNGFLRQSPTEDNPWQEHRSGWRPDELVARGYDVIGVNGWRPLRGEAWEPRVRPPALGHRLSAITQPFVTKRPHLAFQLLAVRRQDGDR